MAAIAKLFDGHILGKSNEEIDLEEDEEYQEKTFGLYFSAHWCAPCCAFTPKLIKFYKKYAEKKSFEIIFISSDEDEKSFDEYYKDMPWLKLAFDERTKAKELEEKFEVDGIPTLVLVDGDTGDVICADATEQIEDNDPEGKEFPWKSDE